MPQITKRDTLRRLYRNPVGRDVIDKILLGTGLPRRLIHLAAWMPLDWLEKLTLPITGPGLLDTVLNLVNQEPDRPIDGGEPHPTPWWREAVFYQVYPRSFCDADGDGIGDIRGVISKLDHLRDLGVDCVWLSPVFTSPNKDMGYDVSDYRGINPEMGTLEDLDDLIAACHDRGMRLLLDLVVNHTSDQHEWFRKAIDDPDGPYGDYYFMVAGDEASPPNNWRSFFSGPAWSWLPESRRWVLHLFADEQVDLNWDNPDVRDEVAGIVRFWMKRGVDGFRMDVINYISKPPTLPDGHPFIGRMLEFTGVEHYFYGPRLNEYLRELRLEGFTRREKPASTPRRRLPDGRLGGPTQPDRVGLMVGETPGIGMELGRLLSGHGRGELDMVFNFDVLDNPGRTRWDTYRYDPYYLKRYYRAHLKHLSAGDWIAVFLDNHDNPRMLSKFGMGREQDPAVRTAIGKMLATIQLTMRGSPFLYQGQELAAINQSFAGIDEIRDVDSINRYNTLVAGGVAPEKAWRQLLTGSRDHSRVPMRWTPTDGFTNGNAWLVGTDRQPGFSAEEQAADPSSVFSWHRDLIRLRRTHRALTVGTLEWVHPHHRFYFAYYRRFEGEAFLVECNTSSKPRKRPVVEGEIEPVLGGPRRPVMAPWEATVSRVR